jgi:hypothetical protein
MNLTGIGQASSFGAAGTSAGVASSGGSAVESSSQGAAASNPFSQLIDLLQGTASEETTVSQPDGASVTTVPGPDGTSRMVSETQNGTTLTEVGYVSPVLLRHFVTSLFQTLQATGPTASPTAGTGAARGGAVSTSSAALNALLGKLQSGATADPSMQDLLQSFGALMQGSGLAPPSGGGAQWTSANTAAALTSFLQSAAPSLEDGAISPTGINVNAVA